MDAALLDTDLLSEILKQRDPIVVQKGAEYLQEHGQFPSSIFTRFEIARGYKEKRANRQLAKFNVFCRHSLVLPLTELVCFELRRTSGPLHVVAGTRPATPTF